MTDFDDQAETVTVRAGKFGKSRLPPVHATTADRLRQYLTHRGQFILIEQVRGDRGRRTIRM